MPANSFLKSTYFNLITPIALAIAAGIGLTARPGCAVTFNFNSASDIETLALEGFIAAGNFWSEQFIDDVTINIDIGFKALDDGVLSIADSIRSSYSYSDVYNALVIDKTSTDDTIAVSNLPKNSSLLLLLNRTSNNPNGAGSATPYLDDDGDDNNSKIWINTANAKALNLLLGDDKETDAFITFSDRFNWDFDNSDGISSGSYDFVGIAAHEIGHALGFMSGVEVLDVNSSDRFYKDNQFTHVSPMDLFRFSEDSVAQGKGVIDWTASITDKYFSIDGGTTKIASFATGEIHGDFQQTSHWKGNPGIGMMKPSSTPGELLAISPQDLQLFDVIGWNLTPTSTELSQIESPISTPTAITAPSNNITATSVPEPSSLIGLMGLSAGFLLKQSNKSKNSGDRIQKKECRRKNSGDRIQKKECRRKNPEFTRKNSERPIVLF